MARIRTIKPEFWSHPVMGKQTDATKCMALALLNLADDEGYFYAEPAVVRSFARPFDDDSTISRGCLDELAMIGFIEIEQHPDRGAVGRVAEFLKHQRIDKAKPSEIKAFFGRNHSTTNPRPFDDGSTIIPRTFDEESPLEGKGKEGKVGDLERIGTEGSGKEEEGKGSDKPAPADASELNASACAGRLMDELLISGLQNRTICDEAIARCAKHRNCTATKATEHILAQAKLYQQSEQYASHWRKPWVKWLSGGHWNEAPEQWKEGLHDSDGVPPSPKGRSIRERIRRQRAGLDPDGPEPTPPELLVK